MDDFNYLLHREQTELLRAAKATSFTHKAAHMDMARSYAIRIAHHPLPYRTPQAPGVTRFNPGRFGVNPPTYVKLVSGSGAA